MKHSFGEKYAFSRGRREKTDLDTIKVHLPGCVSVVKTDENTDRSGIDYVATLRRGAQVLIDGKARERGCSRWWRHGPEVALEIWSVRPGGKFEMPYERSKTGWTLSEKSNVDMILFTWHPSDTTDVYLVGFQGLRMAFREYMPEWKQLYKHDVQESESWESECIFVPIHVVHEAIAVVSRNVVRDCDGMPLFSEK